MSDDTQEFLSQIEEISNSTTDMLHRGLFASTYRRNGDIIRIARANRLLIPYLNGMFFQMVRCLYLLDPARLRESAVTLIPFLEDEEYARSFQSDFDEHEYEYTKSWMTACVYENLADATGEAGGYNSDGMHQCIADGLQVCRRTGKLSCISCFRSYAADVYLASDDFTMARHQCENVINHHGSWSDRGDIRSGICQKLSSMYLLDGQVESALKSAQDAMTFSTAEGVNIQYITRAESLMVMDQALIVAGKERIDWSNPDPEGVVEALPPEGEWPRLEMEKDRNDALEHCLQERYDEAIRLLTRWDRELDRRSCLALWFEIRLRLMAAMALAGQTDRLERLADQLRKRAVESGDYLSIRRLNCLMDPDMPTSPLAALEPVRNDPVAVTSGAATVSETQSPVAESSGSEADDTDEDAEELNPVLDQVNSILNQFFGNEDESERDGLISQYLSVSAEEFEDPRQAAAVLHFAGPLNGDGERAAEFWEWARKFEQQFPDTAGIISRVASLGNTLRYSGGEATHDLVDGELIEGMFRRAMSLNQDSISAHWLAGEHFLFHEEHGEAERCLARACRLERSFSTPALLLAEVYSRTDRPRDALAVLDMCLREGCDDSNVAWEALVRSVNAQQFEAGLAYADRYEELEPEEPWVNYYRGLALVELGRPDDALQRIEQELQREDLPGIWHLEVLQACAFVQLERTDETQETLDRVLGTSVSSVTFMTQAGIVNLLHLLWKHTERLGVGNSQRRTLQELLLAASVMPDPFFEDRRMAAKEDRGGEQEAGFYQVLLEQPLTPDWKQSPGCFVGQEHWNSYRVVWGVLATGEEQAGQLALEAQRLCMAQPAEVAGIALSEEGFRDVPGVVWVGERWNEEEPTGDSPEESGADI